MLLNSQVPHTCPTPHWILFSLAITFQEIKLLTFWGKNYPIKFSDLAENFQIIPVSPTFHLSLLSFIYFLFQTFCSWMLFVRLFVLRGGPPAKGGRCSGSAHKEDCALIRSSGIKATRVTKCPMEWYFLNFLLILRHCDTPRNAVFLRVPPLGLPVIVVVAGNICYSLALSFPKKIITACWMHIIEGCAIGGNNTLRTKMPEPAHPVPGARCTAACGGRWRSRSPGAPRRPSSSFSQIHAGPGTAIIFNT